MVIDGVLLNRFQDSVSLLDSAVSAARMPSVIEAEPLAAALTTCGVTVNSTPPAGQLDEYPFARLFASSLLIQLGCLLQVVADEMPPVSQTCTSRAVHERDHTSCVCRV